MTKTVYIRITDPIEQRNLSVLFPLVDPKWNDNCRLRTNSHYNIGDARYFVYWLDYDRQEGVEDVQIIERILKEETYE